MKSWGVLLAMAGLAYAAPASAATSCTGLIAGVHTVKNGEVMIQPAWHSNWTAICSLNETWKGIPSQTCWGWFAHVNSALIENKRVTIYYDTLPDQSACATMPTYSESPAPYYVMLLKQ